MKKIYYCAFILIFTGFMDGAEAPPKQLSTTREPGSFDKLPIELKALFLKFLVEADDFKGNYFQKLQFAAKNIRHYMMVNKRMSRYLDDKALNGYLIQELARRYRSFLSEATAALHTPGAGKWFAQWAAENNIRRNGPFLVGKTQTAIKDYVHSANILLRYINKDILEGVNFILTYIPEVINFRVNTKEGGSSTLLIEAVKHGNLQIVDRILQTPGPTTQILNAQYHGNDTINGTALIYAVQRGDLAIVNRLLQMPDIDVNIRHLPGVVRYAYDNKPALKIAKSLPNSNPHKKAIIDALIAKGATD